MYLKGMDKLREKLPDYPGGKIVLIPLKGVVAFIIGYELMLLVDLLPRLLTDNSALVVIEPYLPIIGSLVIAITSYHLIGKMWSLREEMQKKHGRLAYQKMISTGVVGVMLIPSLIIHTATPFESLISMSPRNEITTLFSRSLLNILNVPPTLDITVRIALSIFFAVLGALTIRSAMFTFGIDYMTVVYLYFPEESEVQNSEIYSIIRHPTYFAIILLGIAALMIQSSIYSIVIFCILYALVRIHIKREEGELIERFGEGYKEYMKKTPALFVRLSDLPVFISFLKQNR